MKTASIYANAAMPLFIDPMTNLIPDAVGRASMMKSKEPSNNKPTQTVNELKFYAKIAEGTSDMFLKGKHSLKKTHATA